MFRVDSLNFGVYRQRTHIKFCYLFVFDRVWFISACFGMVQVVVTYADSPDILFPTSCGNSPFMLLLLWESANETEKHDVSDSVRASQFLVSCDRVKYDWSQLSKKIDRVFCATVAMFNTPPHLLCTQPIKTFFIKLFVRFWCSTVQSTKPFIACTASVTDWYAVN